MKKLVFLSLITFSFTPKARAQKVAYEVYAIRFASTSHPWSISDWADKGPINDSINIDFMVWLIKGNNGKNILVDAGFINDIEDAKDFSVVKYVRPDSALIKLGMTAADITDIILSHPHWDHIDGINLFPNAHIWIQKEDFNYFVGAAWQKGGNNGGFNKRDIRKLIEFNLAGKLTLVNGDNQQVLPGIKVYTGSRHTFNSQYVLVETGISKIIIASDNIWIYYSLEHLRPPSTGGTLDPIGYVNAVKRMKHLASGSKYIIPGHDSKVFSRFQNISEGVVKIK